MNSLSRRRVIELATSFAAAAPWLSPARSRAQPKPATVLDMASFVGAGLDADAAFAKVIAAVAKATAEAGEATAPVPILLNLEKNAVYRIKRPLALKQLNGFTLNGNGAALINTTRGSTLLISGSKQVTVRDLSIDYDPLPFTQGTVTGFDHAALEIMIKVDAGYPDEPDFLATITDGFFKVMNRATRALKPGARDFLSPKKVERVGAGVIRVTLQWSANETFPSQLPLAVGDVVAISNSYADAIVVDGSSATSFSGLKLLASPAMGILENGGPGGMRLQHVTIAPGPRPKGASTDRLVSTNSDGSHFITVERGPTIEDCTFANTSDDAVNVHGFYYYVVRQTGPQRYLLSPKWDIGLAAGDEIETCQQGTFRSLGRTKIVELTKRKVPELKAEIAKLWKGRSPTTQPDLVYEIVLQQNTPLKVADAVTSLARIGAGTAIRRCSFHACGRVLVKSPNSMVEDCQFTYSSGVALQAGSDIGFWSESGFAENLIFRNNHLAHSILGANELTLGSGALGAIYVGMVAPEGAKGFQNNFQNRNVTIQGNHIDDSYIYAIFVSNADGIKIIGNAIGQTFIRGAAFGAGGIYGLIPNSGIAIGRSRNAEISNNTVARGRLAKAAVAVDRTCDAASVHVGNNTLV
ncbi:MAG TPA: right-handed parallel beta-helix repeat-containing protein [Xanthobacteraceae bacterium]|nr:right-handed parallel beta-helix repeat-containing protein [Xanthobacteraceae bacterium]